MGHLNKEITRPPEAVKRLGNSIFINEKARKLNSSDTEVVYTNNKLLRELGLIICTKQEEIDLMIKNCFAFKLIGNNRPRNDDTEVRVDRQADPTGIALSGNLGSGRSFYIGSCFNIKGVGRTKLAKCAKDDVHGTGTLDLITAIREALTSNYIYENTETRTAPVLAVISLKQWTKYPWSDTPLQDALLIRLDRGKLDRVSHVAYAKPNRSIDIRKIVEGYARFDAEMFAHQILHGSWSTGNLTLEGNWLDMESVAFLKGRAPHFNSTKKYLSNRFGYESIGAKQVIKQLLDITGCGKYDAWSKYFDKMRAKFIHQEFHKLLCVDPKIKPSRESTKLASGFEDLSRKISPRQTNLIVIENNESGNHLLDFRNLFTNLHKIVEDPNPVSKMLGYLVRDDEAEHCNVSVVQTSNICEEYLADNLIVTRRNLKSFREDASGFCQNMFEYLRLLENKRLLRKDDEWGKRLVEVNRQMPTFDELTSDIRNIVKEAKQKGWAEVLRGKLKKLI